ncbi:hypothetical protein Desdi_3102 [Desulfitobacterium dichloroeliminans LMG P-21439]|uniref:Uncharacterized protein n=1 Tax=Desulfitobacterium dichloroeliminans (strain LMG P-21439 / DCA1) TaxID=871963 RepID=L0FC48_DESDL|nr:hypothetical protein Desdi_3102 [Desulfitobacterium dichloroeliminans LMG P-21439]
MCAQCVVRERLARLTEEDTFAENVAMSGLWKMKVVLRYIESPVMGPSCACVLKRTLPWTFLQQLADTMDIDNMEVVNRSKYF